MLPIYIIYARRSSDAEDHQTLSIEQQLEELRRLAVARSLDVAEELIENASAKDPGRPIFADLIKRIKTGKVQGILTWKLDRLARNMVDGGTLIYELQSGHLKEIVTPEATYTAARDSKFMLAMLFGAAAKYPNDLAMAASRERTRVQGGVGSTSPISPTRALRCRQTPPSPLC